MSILLMDAFKKNKQCVNDYYISSLTVTNWEQSSPSPSIITCPVYNCVAIH